MVPYPDLAPGTDTIPQIKHVVILMMEGHSYDNYLGMMKGRGDGFSLDPEGTPVNANRLPNGQLVPAHHMPSTQQSGGAPTDTLNASYVQYDGGACDGFATSVYQTVAGGDPSVPMGYWTQDDLPFYYALARVFPVADRWFSSFLGPARPNRRFLVAGTANGLIDDLSYSNVDRPPAGTIFDLLNEHGISWANYQGNSGRVAIIGPRLLGRPVLTIGRRLIRALSAINPFVLASIHGQLKFTADIYPLGLLDTLRYVRPMQRFFADASAGTLPSVAIIDPDFKTFSGRAPQDVRQAEDFVAAVVNAVMHGKGWEHTLLIWLQDSHGGYYDHVPPPAAVRPDDVPGQFGLSGGSLLARLLYGWRTPLVRQIEHADSGPLTYDRLGFRVPAVLVSPYARPDFVSSTVYDHTSVLALIERKWNLPALTKRDAAAADPLDMVDLASPPAFLSPPTLPLPASAFRPPTPPLVNASAAFSIASTRDVPTRIMQVMAAWTIGFLAFGGSLAWLQTLVLVVLTYLTFNGVRRSQFWRQWIFWRPKRQEKRVAIYNTVFAFITLSAFSALLSSELYLYGPFQIAGHRAGGNILWMYTETYFWNFVDAVPGLEIPGTLHWASPLEVSGVWGELYLILFRLLVLSPVIALIVQSVQAEKPDKEEQDSKREEPPPSSSSASTRV